MEIFTNWIFWAALATIVLLFALIGYLAENRKKSSKAVNNQETNKNDDTNVVINNTKENLTQTIEQPKITDTQNTVDNSNVTVPTPEGATLNLDNGTWNNSTQEIASSVKMSEPISFETPETILSSKMQNEVETSPLPETSIPAEPVVSSLPETSTPAEPVVSSLPETSMPAEPVVSSLPETSMPAEPVVSPSPETSTPAEPVVSPSPEAGATSPQDNGIEIWK